MINIGKGSDPAVLAIYCRNVYFAIFAFGRVNNIPEWEALRSSRAAELVETADYDNSAFIAARCFSIDGSEIILCSSRP